MNASRQLAPDLTRINLRLLRYFQVVAQELSFSKAALRLNMSQPPLSLHIRELEEILQTQLLVRTTRSVGLTPAGRLLLDEVDRILENIDDSLRQVSQLGRAEAEHIQLGVVGTAVWGVLLSTLRRFVAASPQVTWSLTELSPAQQINALQHHHIDLGVCRTDHITLPPGLTSQLIGREEIVLAVSAEHALAGQSVVALEDLAAEDFVSLSVQESSLGAFVYAACLERGLSPRLVHQVAEPQTALALVADGYGIALLPASCARIAWPGVGFCALRERLAADLYAVYDPCQRSPAVSAFLQLLQASQSG
ncbi:LysR family transcriptional regulator [Ralstonia sp. 25C]|uniref:LysR family transcriptional regulator n=1 Tax=Ralstonia sp. 25C TaxID=3447363 RepID=UPI003F7540EA